MRLSRLEYKSDIKIKSEAIKNIFRRYCPIMNKWFDFGLFYTMETYCIICKKYLYPNILVKGKLNKIG